MAGQHLPIHLIPQSQVPNFEVLVSSGDSLIFPYVPHDAAPGKLGDTNAIGDPAKGSPLHPVLAGIKSVRTDAFRRREQTGETDEVKKILQAARLQSLVLSRINKAHLNLMSTGRSPFETAPIIRDYIATRDRELSADLDGYRSYLLLCLYSMNNGILPNLPDHAFNLAVSDGRGENDQPPSDEVLLEAGKDYVEGQLVKNDIRDERLKFEWMTSMVIVDFLETSVTTGGFAH